MEKPSVSREQIARFCRANHIRRLGFFGSLVKGNFGPGSDIDVLVEFESGHTPGLAFFEIEEELSRMFQRRVDLNTPGFLSRYFRDEVLNNLDVQYES